MLKHYEEWGSPSTYPHMSAGWAVATDAPFTWTKQGVGFSPGRLWFPRGDVVRQQPFGGVGVDLDAVTGPIGLARVGVRAGQNESGHGWSSRV